jgi:tryptophan synthase alpha chain
MNRLDTAFAALRERNEGALIPLVPGDTEPFVISMEIIDMFAEARADAIEIAIPTRYPWMEGKAMQIHQLEAIEQGVRPADSFGLMMEAREKYPEWPLVTINFMGPVLTYGQGNYVSGCARASMDAVDIPDYPLARSDDVLGFGAQLLAKNTYFVADITTDLAVAPEGTPEYDLLRKLIRRSGGFLFMIAQAGGISGTKDALPVDVLKPAVERVKELEDGMGVHTPVIVVCGISTPEQVRGSIRDVGADGVMLGSAVSKRLQAGEPVERVQPFVTELKDATRL